MEQYLFHFLFRTFDTVVRTILNFSTFRFSIFERKAALLELKSTRPSSRCKARRWRENLQTNTRFPPVGKSGGGGKPGNENSPGGDYDTSAAGYRPDRIEKPNRRRGNAVDAVFLVSAYAKPLAAAVHRGRRPASVVLE